MIPVLINNRNRLTWPRAMADEIRRMGGTPVILDNVSTYQPLLDWYSSGGVDLPRVMFLAENGGPRGFWEKTRVTQDVQWYLRQWLDHDIRRKPFVFTDPDLDLSGLPNDTLNVLVHEAEARNVKVGVGLRISDIPDHYPLKDLVQTIESEYWTSIVGHLSFRGIYRSHPVPVYKAGVDTTLAAYPRFAPFTLDGVRLGPPYVARHLPWYADPKNPTDEERYYALHCHLPIHSNICPDRESGVAVGIAALKARYRRD